MWLLSQGLDGWSLMNFSSLMVFSFHLTQVKPCIFIDEKYRLHCVWFISFTLGCGLENEAKNLLFFNIVLLILICI